MNEFEITMLHSLTSDIAADKVQCQWPSGGPLRQPSVDWLDDSKEQSQRLTASP